MVSHELLNGSGSLPQIAKPCRSSQELQCPVAWPFQLLAPGRLRLMSDISAIGYSFTTRWEHRLFSLYFEMVFFQPPKVIFPLGSCFKLAGGLNLLPLLCSTFQKHWLTLIPREHPSQLMPYMTSIQSGPYC